MALPNPADVHVQILTLGDAPIRRDNGAPFQKY
jgi:hypothetical protein